METMIERAVSSTKYLALHHMIVFPHPVLRFQAWQASMVLVHSHALAGALPTMPFRVSRPATP